MTTLNATSRTAVAPYARIARRRAQERRHPLLPLVWGALGIIVPLYWVTALAWFADAVF